jgi:hypothetical protein
MNPYSPVADRISNVETAALQPGQAARTFPFAYSGLIVRGGV